VPELGSHRRNHGDVTDPHNKGTTIKLRSHCRNHGAGRYGFSENQPEKWRHCCKGLGLQTSENLTGVRFNHVFKDRLLLGPVLVPGPPWVLGQGSWYHRGSWDKGPRTAMGPGSNMVLGPVEFQPDWVKTLLGRMSWL
jgi:hypothetical protein